jgi:hypothetical protein
MEKEKARSLSEDATSIKPAAVIGGDKIFVYLIPAEKAAEVIVYSDRYKKLHGGSGVVTISRISGNFAVTAPDDDFGQQILTAMKSIEGLRGGGKPTVRGSLPVESIDFVIKILKDRFED